MPRSEPTLLGQPIQVPQGLRGKCKTCQMYGRPGRLVTDGTEIADVVEETRFNGKFHYRTGDAAVWLNCPGCTHYVQFPLGVRL